MSHLRDVAPVPGGTCALGRFAGKVLQIVVRSYLVHRLPGLRRTVMNLARLRCRPRPPRHPSQLSRHSRLCRRQTLDRQLYVLQFYRSPMCQGTLLMLILARSSLSRFRGLLRIREV